MRKKIDRKIMCLAGFIIMAVAAAYLTRTARALKWHGQYLTVNKAEGYNYIK